MKVRICSTFASIYSNRDSCYNAFVRQLYRKRAIFMKKFSVPVSYYEISRFSTERHYVETRFEVESESIETLLDDLRCSRMRVPLTLSDDEDILNLKFMDNESRQDNEIIDLETNERFYL